MIVVDIYIAAALGVGFVFIMALLALIIREEDDE